MQRVLALLLLAVFGLPSALPLLALRQDAEAGVPLCCRRNGQHHCNMSLAERAGLASSQAPAAPAVQAPASRCPYCPAAVASATPHPLASPTVAKAVFAALVSHPAGSAQTEARGRVAAGRSHHKRGPPALTQA